MSNNILVNEIKRVFPEIEFEEFIEDGNLDIYFDNDDLEKKYIDRFPMKMDFRGIHSIYQTFYYIECEDEDQQEFKNKMFKVDSYRLTKVVLFILNYSKNIIMRTNYYDLLKIKDENANIKFYSNTLEYLLRVDDFTDMDKLILLAFKDIIKIDFYLLDLGITLSLTSDLSCILYTKDNKFDSIIEKISNVEGFYFYK
ncbi:hypothetical protein [Clostridium baratii]|uniref:hypothetical protein n=1 Tax=Clostridium baratii TaxID=1561 RepID=UPI002943D7F7|nr:hypothetical protein [Clostridium baratii]